jgi:hypothetical protein
MKISDPFFDSAKQEPARYSLKESLVGGGTAGL